MEQRGVEYRQARPSDARELAAMRWEFRVEESPGLETREDHDAFLTTVEQWMNDATGGATSFHATSVQPDWASDLKRTVQIGNHIFYRGVPRVRSS